MRVLVCGGREFGDLGMAVMLRSGHPTGQARIAEYYFIHHTLDDIFADWFSDRDVDPLTVIVGKARGADTVGETWARNNGFAVEEYPAEWDKYGKQAGYIRNRKMLDEGKPDLVVAFPGGRGTQMMVDIARKAGVKVREINYNGSNEESGSEEDGS